MVVVVVVMVSSPLTGSNVVRLLLLLFWLFFVVVSPESESSTEIEAESSPPANSIPKRRMPDFSLMGGAGRMKGSWEKESTFMKSRVSLSVVVLSMRREKE